MAVINRCERGRSTDEVCLICGVELAINELANHLGQHMQEAALLALPHDIIEDEKGSGSERVQRSGGDSNIYGQSSLGSSGLEFVYSPGEDGEPKSDYHTDHAGQSANINLGSDLDTQYGNLQGLETLITRSEAAVGLTSPERVGTDMQNSQVSQFGRITGVGGKCTENCELNCELKLFAFLISLCRYTD